jgi:hypothetical protein
MLLLLVARDRGRIGVGHSIASHYFPYRTKPSLGHCRDYTNSQYAHLKMQSRGPDQATSPTIRLSRDKSLKTNIVLRVFRAATLKVRQQGRLVRFARAW